MLAPVAMGSVGVEPATSRCEAGAAGYPDPASQAGSRVRRTLPQHLPQRLGDDSVDRLDAGVELVAADGACACGELAHNAVGSL
jgi:CubicO group peptidase (beta-lactamase class C family)